MPIASTYLADLGPGRRNFASVDRPRCVRLETPAPLLACFARRAGSAVEHALLISRGAHLAHLPRPQGRELFIPDFVGFTVSIRTRKMFVEVRNLRRLERETEQDVRSVQAG